MLGVIFTGGKGPPPQIIKQLLEGKKAFIAAADSGLIAAEAAEIKADFIVGDMDSVDSSMLEKYPPDCVIRHETDKDFSDTELALSMLREKNCGEIWIIGGGGSSRMDHVFGILHLFEREFFPSRWITNSADIFCLESAAERDFPPDAAVNLPYGSTLPKERSFKSTLSAANCEPVYPVKIESIVSIFPLGCRPWEVQSNGLKWPLEKVKWNRGVFSLSNVIIDTNFTITAKTGRFLVAIPKL